MNKAEGKLRKSSKGNTGLLFLPSHLMLDSTFPFKDIPLMVKIRIEGNKLIIER